jgi:hypothetical protein
MIFGPNVGWLTVPVLITVQSTFGLVLHQDTKNKETVFEQLERMNKELSELRNDLKKAHDDNKQLSDTLRKLSELVGQM